MFRIREVFYVNLPLTPYEEVYQRQQEISAQLLQGNGRNVLILVEHPPVYTLGRNTRPKDLPVPKEELEKKGIHMVSVNRGGSVTYHGPGQLVAYPLLDLHDFGEDVHLYLRKLEGMLLHFLTLYGVEAVRKEGLTGVWIDNEKIAALGIGLRRWVTMHGCAVNINIDLDPFHWIVPCGLTDGGVTSLKRVLGKSLDMKEAREKLLVSFSEIFACPLKPLDLEDSTDGKRS